MRLKNDRAQLYSTFFCWEEWELSTTEAPDRHRLLWGIPFSQTTSFHLSMHVCLSFCLSPPTLSLCVSLSPCLSVSLSLPHSVSLSRCFSLSLSLSLYLCRCLCLYDSVSLCMSVYFTLSHYLSVSVSLSLSVCLSHSGVSVMICLFFTDLPPCAPMGP